MTDQQPEPGSRSRSGDASPAGYVVVANDGAGSTEVVAVGAAVARLASEAPTELRWTSDPPDFVELVRELDDDRQLVVAGGDGSIHLALETVTDLGRADRPVGIIPLGTGNDFARNQDIPLDPTDAAEVVIAGHTMGIGAMRLEGEIVDGGQDARMVANNLHVGLGVRAAERASSLKQALKRFAYPVATAYEGVQGDPVELAVTVDGEQIWDGPLLAALVLLGPSMGGGVEMVPDRPHQVDVVLVEPATADERAGLVRAALRGRVFDADRADRAERRRASTVTIAGRDGVRTNIDGELIEFRTPITLTHQRDAWQVFVPRSRAGSLGAGG